MARRSVRRWLADERGAAVVEFAIVVPILLIFVTAIVDFGRMLGVAASLAAAARDGARLGATVTQLDATQKNAIRNRVIGAFQPLGGVALGSGASGAGTVDVTLENNAYVVVRVTGYTYRPITPIATLIGMGTVTLNRTATFRWERTS